MASKIKCLNPDCDKKFIPKRKDRKYCSPKCKADYHNKQKKAEIENLKNQLLEKQKPQENAPAKKIEPKIDNSEVQKLKNEISELKKELDNKNAEIQNLRKKANGIIDKERGKIKKLEAQNEKFKQSNEKLKLELKKAKQPPANLKSRLIIFKCYLEFTKRIDYRLRKDNKIDENEQNIKSFKNRVETFKKTIGNATAEQIFYSYYDEYEGKRDKVSNLIKTRLEILENFSRDLFYWDYQENGKRIHKYSKLELWECLRDCGIEHYEKQDSDLFFKYYDLPKKC